MARPYNVTMADSGGSTKKNTSANANSYNNGTYGSYYGGASAGNTGSNLGLYGSSSAGASVYKPNAYKSTSSSDPSSTVSALDKLKNAVGSNLKTGKSVLGQTGGNDPYTPSYSYTGSDGGSNGGSNGGYSSVNTTTDDIISQIKALLNQQKEASDAYAKSLYEDQLNQIGQYTEANRNQANLNRARTDRYIKGLYGGELSGKGLSNRARNVSNWANKLADIRNSDATMRNNALANYNSNLANNASTLASGWYNYVLPTYTQRQNYLDSLAFNNSHNS